MRLTGLAGLVYAVFVVVFAIALPFVIHYWQEQKRPKIGQIKKRRLRRVMRRWIWVATTACVVGLVGAAVYYLVPNVSVITIPAKGKAYVIIRDAKLDALVAGQPPIFYILVENTGTVEATGNIKDVTSSFGYVEARSLTYQNAESGNFKLAPSEKTTFRYPFDATMLDDWRLKLLNENWDESGNKQVLSFCREYNTIFPSHLVFCDENVTFKEPEPANQ
jgi:hypothetical protein